MVYQETDKKGNQKAAFLCLLWIEKSGSLYVGGIHFYGKENLIATDDYGAL